jgi:hypothetical protein
MGYVRPEFQPAATDYAVDGPHSLRRQSRHDTWRQININEVNIFEMDSSTSSRLYSEPCAGARTKP